MAGPDAGKMTQTRFDAILAAYGGDPRRWPHAERAAAEGFLAANPAAQELVSRALRLDHALGAAEPVGAGAAFEARLLRDFDRLARRWSFRGLAHSVAQSVWPGAPPWQPACAFALAFAVGLGIAAFAPLDVRPPDEGAMGAFALDAPPYDDAGQDI